MKGAIMEQFRLYTLIKGIAAAPYLLLDLIIIGLHTLNVMLAQYQL